jgi:hypothetical protein
MRIDQAGHYDSFASIDSVDAFAAMLRPDVRADGDDSVTGNDDVGGLEPRITRVARDNVGALYDKRRNGFHDAAYDLKGPILSLIISMVLSPARLAKPGSHIGKSLHSKMSGYPLVRRRSCLRAIWIVPLISHAGRANAHAARYPPRGIRFIRCAGEFGEEMGSIRVKRLGWGQ